MRVVRNYMMPIFDHDGTDTSTYLLHLILLQRHCVLQRCHYYETMASCHMCPCIDAARISIPVPAWSDRRSMIDNAADGGMCYI